MTRTKKQHQTTLQQCGVTVGCGCGVHVDNDSRCDGGNVGGCGVGACVRVAGVCGMRIYCVAIGGDVVVTLCC